MSLNKLAKGVAVASDKGPALVSVAGGQVSWEEAWPQERALLLLRALPALCPEGACPPPGCGCEAWSVGPFAFSPKP